MLWRSKEPSRIEGFSDAVFGFALTLLVVSVEVPKTFDELMTVVRGFLPFAITFATIAWLWYEHPYFFRLFDPDDRVTIALNCTLLFTVLLIGVVKGVLGWIYGSKRVRLRAEENLSV